MDDIHSGHRERMRERFFAEGLDHFAPHEVLEYLICLVVPRGDVNAVAHRLIDTFGSLTGVFEASFDELLAVEGVGAKTAQLLCSVPSLARVYMTDSRREGTVLDTYEKMKDFLSPRFIGARKEQLFLVCLNEKRRVLNCTRLNEGTIQKVAVDMRNILEIVLRTSATSVILAHNHPGQLAVPSRDDVAATRYVASVLRTVSVRVLDHLVFSGADCVSMRERGYFAEKEG